MASYTSGYKGVAWSKSHKKWQAYVRNEDKKLMHLGYFDDPAVAHAAYCSTAGNLYGGFFRNEVT